VNLEAGKSYKIRVEYRHQGFKAACVMGLQKKDFTSIEQAVQAAKESDVAVIFAGISFFEEREGADLPSLHLPENQEILIKRVAQANPNTVVILNNGTALLLTEWIDHIPAVVEAWYPGQYGGDVIADILFGNINPSGKLPVTFMKKWEDTPVHQYYPAPDVVGAHEVDMNVDDAFGNENRKNLDMPYKEGIYVGYRHYDKFDVEPLFAFGHGLSYTSFDYKDLEIKKRKNTIDVRFAVTNTGSIAGAEVAQLYVEDMESILDRPVKELKGFHKVLLNPGETKEITLQLEKNDLAFFDPDKDVWTVEPGDFTVHIGSSSRDMRLAESFKW
jgi:beta-glucosidase